MAVILDAGALVAMDRGDRQVHITLAKIGRTKRLTSCAVVSQVWREGDRQARLALALKGIDVIPLDAKVDRRIGELLKQARTSDVVDGHVAMLTCAGDYVITSDPSDIARLLDARGVNAVVLRA